MKPNYRLLVGSLACALLPLICKAAPGAPVPAVTAPAEPSVVELGGGGRPVGEGFSRSAVYASNGIAATAQPLASQVAVDILQAGAVR